MVAAGRVHRLVAASAVNGHSWLVLALGALMLLGIACNGSETDPEQDEGGIVYRPKLLPFPWNLQAPLSKAALSANPGGIWSLNYELEVDLTRHSARYGTFTHLILAVQGHLRHDRRGNYRVGASSYAVTSNFTATGFPVERYDAWPSLRLLHSKDGSPFEGVEEFKLPPGAALRDRHTFQGKLEVRLPAAIPEGYYQPRVMVFARIEGVPNPVLLENYGDNSNNISELLLPLVAVGKPAPPRLPWTIFHDVKYRGQVGTLPQEERGIAELCNRSGFRSRLILPPGEYDLSPGFPSLYPFSAVPDLAGGREVFPERLENDLDFANGKVWCSIEGPGGHADLGSREIVDENDEAYGPVLEQGGFRHNFSRTGEYTVRLKGHIHDRFGRKFTGGGTYKVNIALPLSYSTSCKPGTSFLVGDTYPAKVNVNPPFPAEMEVEVDYLPNSDTALKKTWVARGRANKYGHFVPGREHPPLLFDKPGEYRSRVTARYTDARGRLWMAEQVSGGVIAPQRPLMRLHGTRSFPYDLKLNKAYLGGVKRFSGRQANSLSFLPFKPSPLPASFVPHDPRDTLFISPNMFGENIVEPHLSVSIDDPALSAKLQRAHRQRSVSPPPLLQPRKDKWLYLRDVVEISADSSAWFPSDPDHADELPIRSVGKDGLHPFAYPAHRTMQSYFYLGVVRPGFPVLTTALESEALGLYWLTSPNRFGHQFNSSQNGDLPGDVYRVQAGAVLIDSASGEHHYDAYSAGISVVQGDGADNGIMPPGASPLVQTSGRDHYIFLATDGFDALEVGESMGFGGMIFPALEADVRWEVALPSGQTKTVVGKANRLGIVRGPPLLNLEQPGIYQIKATVTHNKLKGDVVGTRDGTFWHCVLPLTGPALLKTNAPVRQKVDPRRGMHIALRWPKQLKNVRLHYGVMMPGRILDQDHLEPVGNKWEYRFSPVMMAVWIPNLDVRNFSNGEWGLADTLVFQFVLEAEQAGEKVYDSVRLVLRGDTLHNYQALMKPGQRHPGKR